MLLICERRSLPVKDSGGTIRHWGCFSSAGMFSVCHFLPKTFWCEFKIWGSRLFSSPENNFYFLAFVSVSLCLFLVELCRTEVSIFVKSTNKQKPNCLWLYFWINLGIVARLFRATVAFEECESCSAIEHIFCFPRYKNMYLGKTRPHNDTTAKHTSYSVKVWKTGYSCLTVEITLSWVNSMWAHRQRGWSASCLLFFVP